MAEVPSTELSLIKEALETSKAEMEQLMRDEDWFVSDVVDLNESALEIVYGHLGLHPAEEEDYDDEV